MSLFLVNVRFTFLEGNTYYIRQQASLVSWQKPEKLGFEHPQAQPVLSWWTYFCGFKIFTGMGKGRAYPGTVKETFLKCKKL